MTGDRVLSEGRGFSRAVKVPNRFGASAPERIEIGGAQAPLTHMRRLLISLLLLAALPASAQLTNAPAEKELKQLLADFLAVASHSPVSAADKQMFNRFFADDVLYTRSAGATTTKQEIMTSLDQPADPKAPAVTFTAEDVTVHQFGKFAVVAFKLVQKSADGSVNEYRNTGTFQRRKVGWQVVAWQATRIPKPEPAKEQPK